MKKIYVLNNGETKGDYSLEEVKDRVKFGIFQITDLCWIEGWDDWKPLSFIVREAELKPKLVPISEYIAENCDHTRNSTPLSHQDEFIKPFLKRLQRSSKYFIEQRIIIGRFGDASVQEKWFIEEDPLASSIALLSYFALFIHSGKPSAVESVVNALTSYNDYSFSDGVDSDSRINLISFIYYKLQDSFSDAEIEAMDGLFEYGLPFRLDLPDAFKDKSKVLKSFTTKCYYLNQDFIATISLMLGMNVIAYPLGFGILYEHVMRNIPSKLVLRTGLALSKIALAYVEGRIKSNREATGHLNIAIRSCLFANDVL